MVELKRRLVVFYDYVENVLEARAPHRPAHIELYHEFRSSGRLLMGGAFDPPTGALIVFADDDQSVVDDFIARDPYVQNGVVTGWRVEAWNVVE